MLPSMLIYTCQEENTSNKKKRMVIKMVGYYYCVEAQHIPGSDYHWYIERYYRTESACRRFIKWLIRKGYYKPEQLRIITSPDYEW